MLVPIIRAQTATPLLAVADALCAPTHSTGIVLGIVELPRRGVPDLKRLVEERRHDLLRWIASVDTAERQSGLTIQMRVSHDVPLGLREAVYENGCDLIVVEWPGLTTNRPKLVGAVLEELATDPPADLVLVRPDRPGRLPGEGAILVPVRGGPNARLAIRIAEAIAETRNAHLTLLHVSDTRHHPQRRLAMEEAFREMVAEVRYRDVEATVRGSENAAETILTESRDYRTVVLGAYADPPRSPVLVRSELASMVRRLRGTVILTRKA